MTNINTAKSVSASATPVHGGLRTQLLAGSATCYTDVCWLAALNTNVFNSFKRNKIYNGILEHVSPEIGAQYIAEIERHQIIDLIRDRDKLTVNDIYGSPSVVNYPNIGSFSPSTLRYTKVTSDIIRLFFGDMAKANAGDGCSIVEIGIGYGGQCLLLSNFIKIHTYTLLDVTPALALAKRYLENFALPFKVEYRTLNEIDRVDNDICISNYAFSELNRHLQDMYINKVIRHSPMGYMTYNTVSDAGFATYTAAEFCDTLPYKSHIIDETPLTHKDNVIVYWNRDKLPCR